ncbi:MAG: SsrA-binding protein SmpB [Cytophagales bacterium]|nr:MAG: SsrA-binding protein SmpB [Cytophagales bacterium]
MAKLKDRILKNVSIRNKKASFEYQFLDKYTAGLQLKGSEIKSIRLGKVNMDAAYCLFNNGEFFVRDMNITEYEKGTFYNHFAKADRKLLLKKRELRRIQNELNNVGLTVVPIHLFVNDKGLAKLEIAIAKGKKLFDKRESIKERDVKREMAREE